MLMPAVVVSLVLFVAPLGFLVIESAHRFSLTGAAMGLTWANYARLLSDGYYLGLLGETFKLAALASGICLVVGMPVAWCLRLAHPRLRGLLLLGVLAPLLVSVVVRSFGWIVILGEFGLLNAVMARLGFPGGPTHLFTEAAVLAGLVHVFFPFMVLALFGALQKIDLRLVRAARSLGANRVQAFAAILPLMAPGIAAGVATVFALATGSYVTVAIGCTGGQHRSVFLVEQLARGFGDRWAALKRHRELDAT